MENLHEINEIIIDWIASIDSLVEEKSKNFSVETKTSEFDLVTNIDKEIQNSFQTLLNNHFPKHNLVGEEKDNHDIDMYSGIVWVIDPIDGTTNLVKQGKNYCLILSLFIEGEILLAYTYDFYNKKLFKAIKGEGVTINEKSIVLNEIQKPEDGLIAFKPSMVNDALLRELISVSHGYRFIGAGGLDGVRVILGDYGASIDFNASIWDMSAQILFANELGLKISDLHGNKINLNNVKGSIIAHSGIHKILVEIIKKYSLH